MVSNASDDLPEPLMPVITIILFRGRSSFTSFRLCSRAPLIFSSSLFTWQQFLADMFDLVPEPGRVLEAQLLREQPHLFLHVQEQALELRGGHPPRPLDGIVGRPRPGSQRDLEYVPDLLLDGLRADAVLLVVEHLLLAPSLRLLDGASHGLGSVLCVEYHHPARIPAGPAHRLDQAPLAAQEPLLVGCLL